MNGKKFKFSVIIPIYNVEAYLEETLASVIGQTIGFRENIQLILVNDGSPDNSEAICLKYRDLYPDNVVYVKQENAGVSAARNKGMEFIQGSYVNFLDSDDKWTDNTFAEVDRFFQTYGDEVDLVGCRLRYFDARNNYHVLDYKYNETKVVDITEDYMFVHMNMAPVFVRAEVLKGLCFDKKLKYAEDAKLANQIILQKGKYGVIREAEYLYRVRRDSSSAMQNTTKSKQWYTDTLRGFHCYMLELSKEKFGTVIPYVQYVLMYDISWRVKAKVPEGLLTEAEYKAYYDTLVAILQQIDDKIIDEQKYFNGACKKLALSIKYQKDISKEIIFKKGHIYYGGCKLTNLNKVRFLSIDFMSIKEDTLYIEGFAEYWLPYEDYKIAFIDQNENKYYVEFFEYDKKNCYGLTGLYAFTRGYTIEIPLEKVTKLKPVLEYRTGDSCVLPVEYRKFVKLDKHVQKSYGVYDKYLLRTAGKSIVVKKRSKKRFKEYEKAYCRELRELKKTRLIKYRICNRLLRRFKKNEIWLVSDRINVARDNGEAFFEYLCRTKPEGIKPYFVLDRKSIDYKRIRKIGKVVSPNSFWYKVLFLAASKIISAHADENVINAFGNDRPFMKNMYDFDYVFLQHGITKDDLSSWLNRYNKNISMFVTTAVGEYQSILDYDYGYDEKVVKLTGFPRYDKLAQTEPVKKQIIFLTTWRQKLAGKMDLVSGQREYNEEFKNSEYCQFYNRLINDERLLAVMRKKGYTGKFCLHNNHMVQAGDFKGNDVIHIHTDAIEYVKEFKENALMLTDYSSVAFDFAYLGKPIVYVQFDREAFFEGQVYDPGYYDYDRDGFGPVCYDYESTVERLINAIENDCVLTAEYRERIDRFFYKTDTKNCERVYQEIKAL